MKPFKLSELRRRMVYIAEQTLATPKGGEAFEALQCEIANIVAERDRRIAELEAEVAALVHPFDLAAYRAKKGELAK